MKYIQENWITCEQEKDPSTLAVAGISVSSETRALPHLSRTVSSSPRSPPINATTTAGCRSISFTVVLYFLTFESKKRKRKISLATVISRVGTRATSLPIRGVNVFAAGGDHIPFRYPGRTATSRRRHGLVGADQNTSPLRLFQKHIYRALADAVYPFVWQLPLMTFFYFAG